MKYEYELISHNYIRGFHLFLVRILYRTPHLHREFEVNLILDGSVEILSQGREYHAETGDFFVFDPYQPHELRAREGTVLILSIQISPAFFSDYFPQMESVRFGTEIFHRAASPRHQQLYRQLLELTCCYCQKAPFYELDCAGNINALFRALLDVSAFTVVSEAERPAQRARQERVRYLAERIEGGFSEKLLLGDLAKELGVDLYYLSHFFREHFGLSFQEYLAKLRCEKARRELLLSGFSVGRSVIGTMTTTLMLAYSGSYLSMLMYFAGQGTPLVDIANLKYVASEVLTTLVGSFGLVTVAPFTAITASLLYTRRRGVRACREAAQG